MSYWWFLSFLLHKILSFKIIDLEVILDSSKNIMEINPKNIYYIKILI